METFEYLLYRMLRWLVRTMSFRTAGVVGEGLGSFAFTVIRYRRNVTLDNLAKAFPETPRGEILRIARGAYRNYGIALVEMMWTAGASEEELWRILRPVNKEIATEAFRRNKGLILLSGHYGSWELIVTSLRLHLGLPTHVIVQHQRNGRIDRLIDADRKRYDTVTIPMGPSVREVLKTLHDHEMVAMLGDQSGPKEAVFVDFFGRPSATHRGAAVFSLKTGAPIVMFFFIRQSDRTYTVEFEEVDRSGLTGYSEENVLELTRRHTAILEKYIRMRPDHWLWMHRRWKHTEFYEMQHQAGVASQPVTHGT